MSLERQDDQRSDNEFTLVDLVGTIGFALYLTFVFLVLSRTSFFVDEISNGAYQGQAAFLLTAFFFGELVASAIIWLLSKYTKDKTARTIALAASSMLMLLPSIALLTDITIFPVLFSVWFLAGIGTLSILALWGRFLSILIHKKAILYPALSVLIEAGLLLVVLYLFKLEAIKLAILVIPLISVFLFGIWENETHGSYLGLSITPPDRKSLLRSGIAMVANNFLIGFTIYTMSISSSAAVGLAAIIAVVCAALFKMYDSSHKQKYEVREIIKIIAPTAAVVLLLFPWVSIEWYVVLVFLMMLVAMTNEIVCWSAVSQYMHVYRLSPYANIAYGRLGDIIGLALGCLCASATFGTSLDTGVALAWVPSLCVIAIIIMQAFFFRDNYSPFSEHRAIDADIDDQIIPPQTGRWKEKCLLFSNDFDLSPRQQEVLFLLAKGYSTGAIEETLVVTSHTVKAHIYNIYRKTDVHTRQELIEKIERF